MEWTTDDWDPALRYWTLPYDPQLNEWLKTVDPSRTYIMAGREFGGKPGLWQFERAELLAKGWLEPRDLGWQPDWALAGVASDWDSAKKSAWGVIRAEIEELQQLMQDDRDRYLAEIDVQADGLPDYVVSFIGASAARYPWTLELINCGLAIGNIAYSYYKQHFHRVRASLLCPGLIPPFGPPAHPSFPSGHSFLGHLIALLLLEIPALRQRYGVFSRPMDGSPGKVVDPNPPPINVTISLGNPAEVTWQGHQLGDDDPVCFQTSGQLPAPIEPGQIYYVLKAGKTANKFRISATVQGSAVSTAGSSQSGTQSIPQNPLKGSGAFDSPLLWLAQRMAKNRERLGVHYASDSNGSRHLAAAIWRALLHETGDKRIVCPTLESVRRHAIAEWATKWP